MPLFRFHRGSLDESLKTTVVVRSFNELVKMLVFSDLVNEVNGKWNALFDIKPYPNEENCFDKRIGWYTMKKIVLISV